MMSRILVTIPSIKNKMASSTVTIHININDLRRRQGSIGFHSFINIIDADLHYKFDEYIIIFISLRDYWFGRNIDGLGRIIYFYVRIKILKYGEYRWKVRCPLKILFFRLYYSPGWTILSTTAKIGFCCLPPSSFLF